MSRKVSNICINEKRQQSGTFSPLLSHTSYKHHLTLITCHAHQRAAPSLLPAKPHPRVCVGSYTSVSVPGVALATKSNPRGRLTCHETTGVTSG